MKKIPMVFLFTAVILASFGQARDEKDQKDRKDQKQTAAVVDEDKDLLSVSFTVEDANEEIQALLNDSRIQRLAADTALGGTFLRKEDFFPYANPTLEDGVMLWYNLDEIDGKMTLVLAAEPMDLRTATRRNIAPRFAKLKYPNNVFRYDPKDPFTIREEKHHIAIEFSNIEIPNVDVVKRQKNFAKLIEKKKTRRQTPFNKSSGLFFQNNADKAHPKGLLWSLVSQTDAVGIRYYLAYKDDERRKDKIRVILVAVDSTGKNIVPGRKDSAKFDEGLIVQKSIPPGK